MSDLNLSIAMGNYDRVQPLLNRNVAIDGVNPVFMLLPPEEIMFRAFRHHEFDITELSLSGYVGSLTRDNPPYIGVPVYLSRAFRHASFYVRNDRDIQEPKDLIGRRIGISEFQSTANVWARAILLDEFGVRPSDIHWVRGQLNAPGRTPELAVPVPDGLTAEPAPDDRSLSDLLAAGEIDGFVGPRPPDCFQQGHPDVRRLFPNSDQIAREYYQSTGIFPVMHILGLRTTLAEQHPWLPAALYKAFARSHRIAMEALCETSTPKVSLPFVDEQLGSAQRLMGRDFWSYGLDGNRDALSTFLRNHHQQGLSPYEVQVDDLFHPSTLMPFVQ
ncbi:ABC transporter substrate-binding protein [Marinovum sp. 2_MG-2023]|uniref:ABC transporter substrate-binding protein n=1 Tax=unclassified Marinovum TaxID=2647166 RepID=UPI0026E390CA|nr:MULTISPECIES: ABC transporter substrate-binding protein [unclassified Marinovum]MDO6730876.1 ABC transporter substrate-binding protein [Marinovum sp. 2_MG-2023]MDO6780103.1 ABC transporter substrate-binding protein [Marinovum sp. 1_MG-2023]